MYFCPPSFFSCPIVPSSLPFTKGLTVSQYFGHLGLKTIIDVAPLSVKYCGSYFYKLQCWFVALNSRIYDDIVKHHRANLIRLYSLSPRGCMFDSSDFDSNFEVARLFLTYFEASRSCTLSNYWPM